MTEAIAVSPEVIAEQYLDAWQRHDLDVILALHTDDSVFTSVATGREATGGHAVGEAIAQVFAVWPDLRFQPFRVYTTPEVIVAESVIEATQALSLPLRGTVLEPNGQKVGPGQQDGPCVEARPERFRHHLR